MDEAPELAPPWSVKEIAVLGLAAAAGWLWWNANAKTQRREAMIEEEGNQVLSAILDRQRRHATRAAAQEVGDFMKDDIADRVVGSLIIIGCSM